MPLRDQIKGQPSPNGEVAFTMVPVIQAVALLPDHLIKVGLGLYLLPALLAVFAVGAICALVLAAGELFYGSISCEAHSLREQVGREIFRS